MSKHQRRASEQWDEMASKTKDDHTHEDESEAHKLFRAVPGHGKGTTQEPVIGEEHEEPVPGMASPGSTATANGWSFDSEDWANFGQGAPEVGPIPGGCERPSVIDLNKLGGNVNEYGPTTGVIALRKAVADYYNRTFRQGLPSQYTHENIWYDASVQTDKNFTLIKKDIVPGGRAGLTRVASVISDVYVSYQVPEYTAYDQMLSSFRRLVPIPTTLDPEDAYKLNIQRLKKNIKEQGLSVVVASNPRNPTGQVIKGEELEELVQIAKDGTTLVLDEFYSWYQYELEEGGCVSAASYIEDVNKDPVILIDGLTKNHRLPGWRVCWVVGPKHLISALGQAGSFLDGGANHVLQMAAIPMLDEAHVKQDRIALQRHFKMKRDHVVDRLNKMGLIVKNPPSSTFYIWLDLSDLPSPLNSGLVFFEECLKEKTIVVPGLFFDINPSHRRNLFDSPCHHYVRLSFGPALPELDRGLDGIERLLKKVLTRVKDGEDIHDVVGGVKK